MLLATIGDGALADALSSTNRLGDSPAGTLLAAGVRPLFASSLPRSPSFWRASANSRAPSRSLSGGYVVERIAIG